MLAFPNGNRLFGENVISQSYILSFKYSLNNYFL